MTQSDPITEEQADRFECGSKRDADEIVLFTSPYLLATDTTYRSKEYRGHTESVSNMLHLNGSEYHPGAIFFGNHHHFSCTVMISGELSRTMGRKHVFAVDRREEACTTFGPDIRQVWNVRKSDEPESELPEGIVNPHSLQEQKSETIDPPYIVIDDNSTGDEAHSNTEGRDLKCCPKGELGEGRKRKRTNMGMMRKRWVPANRLADTVTKRGLGWSVFSRNEADLGRLR